MNKESVALYQSRELSHVHTTIFSLNEFGSVTFIKGPGKLFKSLSDFYQVMVFIVLSVSPTFFRSHRYKAGKTNRERTEKGGQFGVNSQKNNET